MLQTAIKMPFLSLNSIVIMSDRDVLEKQWSLFIPGASDKDFERVRVKVSPARFEKFNLLSFGLMSFRPFVVNLKRFGVERRKSNRRKNQKRAEKPE
jgi:hypothetical protein